jgi:thiol-disulfide isomerase/thioredoxin
LNQGIGRDRVDRRRHHRPIAIALGARSNRRAPWRQARCDRAKSPINTAKHLLAGLLAGAIGMPAEAPAQDITSRAPPLPVEGQMPSLAGAGPWLHSPPLATEGLRGKVVLVDFWTYSCINWLRTLPYVRAWAEKYRSRGLVVIGVHTPEFEFEKNVDNIRQAAKDMRVDYPVVVDSDYAVWRAFDNQYWPATYLVDAQGRIRHHHFGEGGYERIERVIQQLLAEAGAGAGDGALVSVDPRGAEIAADWERLRSPETYIGRARAERFASSGGAPAPGRAKYVLPARLRLNDWGLAGDWTRQPEFAALHAAGGRIAYRFQARDLHLVMGPATRGTPIRFRVLLDGHAPGADHGLDVDAQGLGTVTDKRLYQLVRQKGPVADRRFEIEFLDPGLDAYVFTFG